MKRITDPTFRYVSAAATNIAETFRRERMRLKREAERQARADEEAKQKVAKIVVRK
jgi:hypothetical protein